MSGDPASAMMRSLLPPEVEVGEDRGQPVVTGFSFPDELEAISTAVQKRRSEFLSVRRCARQCLQRLGFPPTAILPGASGAPLWPPGIVGSMTHCDHYRAAALARSDDLLTIGIDAEPHAPLPDNILQAISLREERHTLRLLSAQSPSICWDRLLFSAKESIYKAWFPRTGLWLEFGDVTVDIKSTGSFSAVVRLPETNDIDCRLRQMIGYWTVERGIAATAVPVRSDDSIRRDPAWKPTRI